MKSGSKNREFGKNRSTPSRGEFEEVDAAFLAFAFEVGLELGAAVDLDGGEGHVGLELVEEAFGVVCGGVAAGLCAGPLGDGVAGGELLDGGASAVEGQGEGVELDDLAWGCGFASLGEASGVWPTAARGALRRSVGTGEMAALSTSLLRMRPVVLSLALYPCRRSRMVSLAVPHIG